MVLTSVRSFLIFALYGVALTSAVAVGDDESGDGSSGSGGSGEEVIVPSRMQHSYPLTGLICFPDGVLLPCDCEHYHHCPCCTDWISGECYKPTYYMWSEWLPCTVCSDMCDETMECRVKYDEIRQLTVPHDEEEGESIPSGFRARKRRESLTGLPTMQNELSWMRDLGKHKCQVQRTECRKRLSGEWSDWDPISECSSTCHQGLVTEARYCLDIDGNDIGFENCTGGEDASHRVVACNTDLCREAGPFTPVGDCYENGTQCLEDRTRVCIHDTDVPRPELTPECQEETIPCPRDDCEFLGVSDYEFGEWGGCNSTCYPGVESRTGNCVFLNNGSASTDCDPITVTEYQPCDEDICSQYTDYAIDGVCSAECGTGTVPYTRNCAVGSLRVPDGCDTENRECNTNICPNYIYVYGEFGECSESCTSGTATRTGTCMDSTTNTTSDQCPDGPTTIDTGPCNEDLCETYGDWTDSGTCSVTCNAGTQLQTRTCDVVGTDPAPTLPPDCIQNTVDCNDGPCVEVGEWDDWTTCNNTCGPGTTTRTRECYLEGTTTPASGCVEDLEESELCNTDLCDSYSEFAEVGGGSCSASFESCQTPVKPWQRTCNGVGVIPDDCEFQYLPCAAGAPTIINMLIMVQRTKELEPEACADSGDIAYPDTRLEDAALLPNFVQQKNFLEGFMCTFNNISSSETQISLAYQSENVCVNLKEFGDDDLFTAVRNMDLDCRTQSFLFWMFCIGSEFTALRTDDPSRDGYRDVIIVVIPATPTSSLNIESFLSNTVVFNIVKTALDGKDLFVVCADDNPSADLIQKMIELACLTRGIVSCSRYLGTIYDDVFTTIQTMLTFI